MKNASQLRIANACPTGEAPAFMITGRVPPQGLGLPRMPFMFRYWPWKSNSSLSDQIVLMTSIHSCAYS